MFIKFYYLQVLLSLSSMNSKASQFSVAKHCPPHSTLVLKFDSFRSESNIPSLGNFAEE